MHHLIHLILCTVTKSKNNELGHYLTDAQLEYFKVTLMDWRADIVKNNNKHQCLLDGGTNEADEIDVACNIANKMTELQLSNNTRQLLHQIDDALEKIENGTYGYCEETGDPIGFNRLKAIPIATLCIEAQTKLEIAKRTKRE